MRDDSSHSRDVAQPEPNRSARQRRALLALILLVPVPSIGVVFGLAEEATTLDTVIFFGCKAWILLLPAAWHVLVDRRRLQFPKFSTRGAAIGAALGVVIAGILLGGYLLLGDQLLDPAMVRAKAEDTGLADPALFIPFFIYICLINSLLEEYVWRWFVFRKSHEVLGGSRRVAWPAIALAALFFTIHHTVALRLQSGWAMTVLGSLGVFIGGAAWSWCYLRFNSIWPGWISHVIVDIAVAVIAWMVIFGV